MKELLLTPETYDGVVGALVGNGVLCTTVCPTGYHVAPEAMDDRSHLTQHFVMAGRRRSGPQHPLINFGTLSRSLQVGGKTREVNSWKQILDVEAAVAISLWTHESLTESTRSLVLLEDNVFLADTSLLNDSDREINLTYTLDYLFGESDVEMSIDRVDDGRDFHFRLEDHLGLILFRSKLLAGAGEIEFETGERGVKVILTAKLAPGESVLLSSWLHFSDRLGFEFPVDIDEIESAVERHEQGWAVFWSRSEVVTGDEDVDTFRTTSLYTLRCQCTPWSIPPTLSSEYWGGGAFHDEMYPFFALLSSNYPELAERMPYFRLTTLPKAIERARGRGALYPWSSTEHGEERDPHGHWLTERFHLGQFAVSIHALWLYTQAAAQLEDLYPVLRELARYYELNMLETDEWGKLGTRACTDFDESVGRVKNGVFTLCAATQTFACATAAASKLGRDPLRIARWRDLADQLKRTLKISLVEEDERTGERYRIPDAKATHSAVLGPVFPFEVDVNSACARNTSAYIHEACRSTKGWKPGLSETFEGHNWMWTAGHLGIVHAMQRNADLAWEAVRLGPASAGAFMSPNEHRNRDDQVVVPWFTTGCGAWLYALNTLFIQVDEEGTVLLPAVPESLENVTIRNLRASEGVVVSAEITNGRLVSLNVRAPRILTWSFRLPEKYLEGRSLYGTVVNRRHGGLRVKEVYLRENEEVSLLA